jgi:hypothetical protein
MGPFPRINPRRLAASVLFVSLAVGCHAPSSTSAEKQTGGEPTQFKIHDGKLELSDQNTKGFYEVIGSRQSETSGNRVSMTGISTGEASVEIDWPLPLADYDQLKEGMSLEEVRPILGLASLKYSTAGPESRLLLTCKQGAAKASLTFSGVPEARLTRKSQTGLK